MVAGMEGGRMNNRRKLVIALGAGALATPFASFAQQQGKVWRIGLLWERQQSAIRLCSFFLCSGNMLS